MNRQKPKKVLKLIAIGYWKMQNEQNVPLPDFPHPTKFQEDHWNEDEKNLVLNHLKNGVSVRHYRGSSWCRFNCDEENMGSTCMTDGVYIYPEGLTHYIEKHQVKLPNEFIEHIRNYVPIALNKYEIEISEINKDWWLNYEP